MLQHRLMRRVSSKVLVIAGVFATSVVGVGWLTLRGPTRQLHRACRVGGLPFDGRLSGFPAPSPRVVSTSAATLRVRSAALEVIKRTKDRHETGVAELILSRPTAAIVNLEHAARLTSHATCWSDLAVAYLASADFERSPHRVTEALAAVDTALRLEPKSTEALFNRAIVLEKMPLREQAIEAWSNYLRLDNRSEWAEEARRRLATLRSQPTRDRWERLAAAFDTQDGSTDTLRVAVRLYPEEARRRTETKLLAHWAVAELAGERASAERWLAMARTVASALVKRNGDSLLTATVAAIDGANDPRRFALARAHQFYDDGRRVYGERSVAAALLLFRKASAEFRAGGSPMAMVAEYYSVSCLDDASDAGTLDKIEQLLAITPQQYPSLRAQMLWLVGTISVRRGKTINGLHAYQDALNLFDRLGETDSATRMRNALAAVNTVIGRSGEAQRLRQEAFKALSETGDARAIQAALELAGRGEAVEQHWLEALSLFSLARDERLRVNPRVHISALLWSALAAHRVDQSAAALRQLVEARRYIQELPDEALRNTAQDDLTFIEGSIRRRSEPARAAALLKGYVQSSLARGRTTFLAEAYLEQARAVRVGGNHNAAAVLYGQAIREIDTQREGAARSGIIDAYFGTADTAARELVDLLASQGRVEEAFGVLDRSRGRALAELDNSIAIEDPLSRLRPDVVAISYLTLTDRLLIFTIDARSGPRLQIVATSAQMLRAASEQFTRALRSGDEREASLLGVKLHRQLIAPIADRIGRARALVIIPGESLAVIPFAALRDPHGKYLFERASIAYAPSVAIAARPRTGRLARNGVLVVGNPDFDRSEFPLPLLAGAKDEAARVRREHAGAKFLTGKDATPRRVLDAVRESGIVHLAAHAVVVPGDPMRSFLLLARDGSASGLLYASEIAAQRIDVEVVVLAACRSAASPQARGDVTTLSLAFLAAGAHNVVGALWDLDDHSAPVVAAAFHRRIAAGDDPAEALRQTQLESAGRVPLATWSAFTLSTVGSSTAHRPPAKMERPVRHTREKGTGGTTS